MARIPGVEQLNKVDAKLRDIANRLDKVSTLYDKMGGALDRYASRNRDIASEQDAIMAAIERQAQHGQQATQGQVEALRDLTKELESVGRRWGAVSQVVAGKAVAAFDKLGKSMLMLGLDGMRLGVNKLEHAIVQIYNVHEKWAKLMGEFRNRLGVTTRGIRELGRVASSVEGTIYGLTGAFGQGAPMVAEFVDGLERVVNVVKGDSMAKLVKDGIMLGRAMGVTAGEAGRLGFMLQQLGEGTASQRDLFKDIQAGAEAAGVSTAAFGKELVQNRSFMTSFGTEGRKMFIQVATYARSLGVSLKSLESFTKMTDTFDSTAQSVAKLNTVFGTTISSLDLMLEQDPSKRLETVRDALLDQGRSFKDLNRQERLFLGETMNLTQEELAGVLQTGKTLDQVQADQEKARARAERDQRNIQRLVAKTSTTLFSFAQAWDRVWMAVQRLIKPFTDAIGLTQSGDKHARTFGQTMKVLFDRFIRFIDEVAKNPEWQGFMRELAGDAETFLKWVSKTVTGSGLTDWVHTVVTGAKGFYEMMRSAFQTMVDLGRKAMPVVKFLLEHVAGISKLWVGMKVVGGLGGGIAGALGEAGKAGLRTAGRGAGKALGGLALRGGGAMMGALATPVGAVVAAAAAMAGAMYWYAKSVKDGLARPQTYAIHLQKGLNEQMERVHSLEEAKAAMDDAIIGKRQAELEEIRKGSDARRKEREFIERNRRLDEQAKRAGGAMGISDLQGAAGRLTTRQNAVDATKNLFKAKAISLSQGSEQKEILRLLTGGTPEELAKAADLAQKQTALDEQKYGYSSRQAQKDRELEKNIIGLNSATMDSIKLERMAAVVKAKLIQSEILQSQLRDPQNRDLAQAIAGLRSGQSLSDLWSDPRFARGSNGLLDSMVSNQGEINSTLGQLGMASGGIVTRPTRALVGEAGPEAVIPLRAMASSGMRQPHKFGGAAAQALVNFAGRRAQGQATGVVVAAGDVYLDGHKVGRHIARAALDGEGH